jgi:hypothetical protein
MDATMDLEGFLRASRGILEGVLEKFSRDSRWILHGIYKGSKGVLEGSRKGA